MTKLMLVVSTALFSTQAFSATHMFFDCKFEAKAHYGRVYVGPMPIDGTCNFENVTVEKFYFDGKSVSAWDTYKSHLGDCASTKSPESYVIFAEINHDTPATPMWQVSRDKNGQFTGNTLVNERDVKMTCERYYK